jgi:acetoin utilization deacetylase AcuC-like enzyme
MHGERNYPAQKTLSSCDVGLPDGIDDATYLAELVRHLPAILRSFEADLVFYLAGVDIAAGDRYGRFALSDAGVRARDRFVVECVRSAGLPLVLTLAGGYAASAERTAQLHAIAFEEAVGFERALAFDAALSAEGRPEPAGQPQREPGCGPAE